ncbi:arsenate reductase/protein-tyrosine-phosphatase family protein [Modestobacter lapidis]|nr:low molecular weight phosphatase family protein [Modestobacter lapidis]
MRLLIVCTGNLCRSPMAAGLLSAWAQRDLGPEGSAVLVGSAGVEAPDGHPMDADSLRAALAAGGDPETLGAHRSRALDPAEVADADLVLTMSRWQRKKVLAHAPRALRRTFTLPEAASLLGLADPRGIADLPLDQRAAELAVRLNAARARRRVSDSDDVRDPIGRRFEEHRRTAERIAGDLHPLAAVLLGSGAVPAAAATAS